MTQNSYDSKLGVPVRMSHSAKLPIAQGQHDARLSTTDGRAGDVPSVQMATGMVASIPIMCELMQTATQHARQLLQREQDERRALRARNAHD